MEKITVRHVAGNTCFFDFPGLSIPFYFLNDREMILLDSGYKINGDLILQYACDHGLRIRAVIHSHIHLDHISGDISLARDPDIRFFGPASEIDNLLSAYRTLLGNGTHRYDNVFTAIQAMELLKEQIHPIDQENSLVFDDCLFSILPAPGHTPFHKLIVTPDDVCYLGDLIMVGKPLTMAKCPYSYDLAKDINTKKTLKTFSYPYYIAAHEGLISPEDLWTCTKRNLAIYGRIFHQISGIRSSHPGISDTELMDLLLKGLTIHLTADILWVKKMLQQYVDYYDSFLESFSRTEWHL